MPSLLSLDISTMTGWAYFASPSSAPRCGTWPAPEGLWESDDYGAFYLAFEDWLLSMLNVMQPEIVAFESPVIASFGQGRGTDESNIRRLVCAVGIVELQAKRKRLICREAHNQTCKAFMGVPGRRPKNMPYQKYKDLMTTAITNRGFDVANDHQADACAVALVVMVDLDLIEE